MQPASITYHSESRELELTYRDGNRVQLSAEYLRVYSPSAEVRGHSADQHVLQKGKRDVKIESVEAVGNYAIKIVFSDGHETGIYSWSYLRELSEEYENNWNTYLHDLEQANASRLPQIPVGHWSPPKES